MLRQSSSAWGEKSSSGKQRTFTHARSNNGGRPRQKAAQENKVAKENTEADPLVKLERASQAVLYAGPPQGAPHSSENDSEGLESWTTDAESWFN